MAWLKADILYATRIQKERFGEEAIDGYGAEFEINQTLVNQACKSDVVIHAPIARDGPTWIL